MSAYILSHYGIVHFGGQFRFVKKALPSCVSARPNKFGLDLIDYLKVRENKDNPNNGNSLGYPTENAWPNYADRIFVSSRRTSLNDDVRVGRQYRYDHGRKESPQTVPTTSLLCILSEESPTRS